MKINVSIVIPAYKAESTIARSVLSARNQKHVNACVIVVVDGLYDNTRQISQKIADKVIINTCNVGAPYSRNIGLSFVEDEYVMFLDADDYIEGEILEGMIDEMQKSKSSLCFSRCFYEFEDGERIGIGIPDISSVGNLVKDWFYRKIVPPCSVLWKTSYIKSIGGWNERVKRNQDGELIMRALASGVRPVYNWKGAGIYYMHTMPHRINMMPDKEKYSATYDTLAVIESMLRASSIWDSVSQEGVAYGYYDLARLCYKSKLNHLGLTCLKNSRRLGLSGHPGSLAHGVLSHMLGLKNKELLSSRISKLLK